MSWKTFAVVGVALSLVAPSVWAKAGGGPSWDYELARDVSRPWRDIAKLAPSRQLPDREVPNHEPLDMAQRGLRTVKAADPLAARQAASAAPTAATPDPSGSFEGLSDDDNAAVIGGRVVPPDTQGDVGPNHYVQHVNLILAVYAKSGGIPIFGPVAGNSIWNGFGGYCESTNDGDPIVLYDHLADRWLVSQFSVDAGAMCIAVSTSPDPTGSYFRYAFAVSPAGSFPDYPKLGVWADGYYMAANEFAGSFVGAIAIAFERSAMLAGGPARFVRRGPLPCDTECYFSLQPSHLNGAAPPAGTPNTYLTAWDDETWGTGAGADGYRMFEFSVDWSSPASSTFTQLPQIITAEFDANLCRYNRSCIPQRRPGEKLAALSTQTMYRSQHRYDAATGTSRLVVNHTVDTNGRDLAGIRWAVLRKVGAAGWAIERNGTHTVGDGLHRWMGSLAMDRVGNLALGYSASSKNEFASIRYATQEDGGTVFGAEVLLQAGGGSQQQSFNRWGDYSTMSVDPVDGCTFWFTNEYYANNGTFDFKTRIGSFRVPGCN